MICCVQTNRGQRPNILRMSEILCLELSVCWCYIQNTLQLGSGLPAESTPTYSFLHRLRPILVAREPSREQKAGRKGARGMWI